MNFKKDYSLIILFLVIIAITNIYWLRENESLFTSDIIMHNEHSRVIYNSLRGQMKTNFFCSEYPPLVHLTTAFVYFILGISPKIASFSLLIYVIIYVVSIWKIGEILWNRNVAWVITLLSATSPIFLSYSRVYFLDLPTTACVTLSLYLLIRSDYFKIKRYSYLWGLSVGLGTLAKKIFFVFIAAPIIYMTFVLLKERWKKSRLEAFIFLIIFSSILAALCGVFWCFINWNFMESFLLILVLYLAIGLAWIIINRREKHLKLKNALSNFFRSLAIGVMISLPYYALAGKIIYSKFSGSLAIAGLKHLIFYLTSIKYLFLWGIFFIGIGIVYTLINKEDRRKNNLILISFAGSLFLILLYRHIQDRYIIPILPYAAVLGGFWIYKIKRMKRVMMCLIIMISAFQLFGWIIKYKFPAYFPFSSYNIHHRPSKEKLESLLLPICSTLPEKYNFYAEDILNDMFQITHSRKAHVIVIGEKRVTGVYRALFAYYSGIKKYPFYFVYDDSLGNVHKIINEMKDVKFLIFITQEPERPQDLEISCCKKLARKLRFVKSYLNFYTPFVSGVNMYIFEILKEGAR